MGRTSEIPDRVIERVIREFDNGSSLNAIAKGLNLDAIPTSQGGKKWYSSTIRLILGKVGRLNPEASTTTDQISVQDIASGRMISQVVHRPVPPTPCALRHCELFAAFNPILQMYVCQDHLESLVHRVCAGLPAAWQILECAHESSIEMVERCYKMCPVVGGDTGWPLPKTFGDYTYIAYDPDDPNERVKIGRSRNPVDRLRQLHVHPVVVFAPGAGFPEAEVHEWFADLKCEAPPSQNQGRTEWYRYEGTLRSWVGTITKGDQLTAA